MNKKNVEEVVSKISDLMLELSDEIKEGTFDLPNGNFSVEFTERGSDM